MSRQARQRAEILALVRLGDLQRAVALASEHVAEFPDDPEVESILREAAAGEVLEDLERSNRT
jgi:hypothetical protein